MKGRRWFVAKNYILAGVSNDSISVRRQRRNLRARIYTPTKLFENGSYSSDSSIFYGTCRAQEIPFFKFIVAYFYLNENWFSFSVSEVHPRFSNVQ